MLAVPMDALGPFVTVGIPIVGGAFMWLFYREYLISDSFWIVVVALVLAGTLVQTENARAAALVLLIGVVLWLWVDRRDEDT